MAPKAGKKKKQQEDDESAAPPAHPATIFHQDQEVTFLDLPAEIRNDIYGYVLEEKETIALKIIFWKHRPRELAREKNDRKKHHRGEVWDKTKRAWVAAPPAHTALMFCNKQIYTEATQVLYGYNTFRLASTTALEEFVTHLGPRAQHLRYIEIAPNGYVKTKLRPALRALGQAKMLRKLQFPHFDFCNPVRLDDPMTVEKLATDCKQLLKALHASYQAQGLTANVLDVVSFANPASCVWCRRGGPPPSVHVRIEVGHHRCKCICDQAEKNTERWNAELRSLLAKKLGILEDDTKDD